MGVFFLKLTIYLMNESVVSFDECIKESYLDNERLQEVNPDQDLPFNAKTFVYSLEPKNPKWIKFISEYFNLDDLKNIAHGFLILLHASERIFAVNFGYSHTVLDRSKVESNFGIRICANSLDPDQLKTIDSRNLDINTKQQRTNLSSVSNLSSFGVEIDEEWIRFLSGKPMNEDIAKSLAGSDSLRINVDIKLDQLDEECSYLYELYLSDSYKEHFGFIDYFCAFNKKDPLVEILNEDLIDKVNLRTHEKISVAHPELFDEQLLDHYKLYFYNRNQVFDELTLQAIYEFMDTYNDIDDPLDKIKIIGLDENDNPVTKSSSIKEYLVCEIEKDNKTYVISSGSWFQVEKNYSTTIRENIKKIRDITNDLNLPKLSDGESEGTYNVKVAELNDWVHFDKNLIKLDEPYQRVEVCDVLTPANLLICVKKMTRSSTLSHLFAQGSVSADLLMGDDNYKSQIVKIASDKGMTINLSEPVPTIVYAIATKKQESLHKSIFLFSAIHLLKNARIIKRLGLHVAIAKIDYD